MSHNLNSWLQSTPQLTLCSLVTYVSVYLCACVFVHLYSLLANPHSGDYIKMALYSLETFVAPFMAAEETKNFRQQSIMMKI